MSKHYLVFTNILLALSIAYSGFTISTSLNKRENLEKVEKRVEEQKFINAETAAVYLGLTPDFFLGLLENQHELKENLEGTDYDVRHFIPYIYLEDELVFNKEQLDTWVEYTMWHQGSL